MTQLRKKEVKELNDTLKKDYNIDNFFDKKDKVAITDNDDILTKNEEAVFFYHKDKLIPTLKLLAKNNFLPTVTVDMGAIKFVISGADIMRPGITDVSEFEKSTPVVIIDEKHGKQLAVGIAILSSSDINESKTGKVIKNIHYVGDNIYNI